MCLFESLKKVKLSKKIKIKKETSVATYRTFSEDDVLKLYTKKPTPKVGSNSSCVIPKLIAPMYTSKPIIFSWLCIEYHITTKDSRGL